jgi:hypothetical protein
MKGKAMQHTTTMRGTPMKAQTTSGVIRLALLACLLLVSMLSSRAVAQSNNFTYEARIRSLDSTIFPGSVVSVPSEGRTVSFVLEARARANSLAVGNSNFGVARFNTGPTGQSPSAITLTDSVPDSRLRRGLIGAFGTGANSGTPLTGRALGFRAGGTTGAMISPWHSTEENGTGGFAFPSATGNAMGAFDLDGDRIYGFDSYAGGTRAGELDPWIADFPAVPMNEFSAWRTLYHFDVRLAPGADRPINLQATGYVAAGIRVVDLGGSWTMNITPAAPASGSVSAQYSFNTGSELPPTFTTIRTVSFTPPQGPAIQYLLVRASRPINWLQASAYAQSQGGLANVATTSEHQWLITNVLSDQNDGQGISRPWIGLSRPLGIPLPSFAWGSGEALAATQWLPQQPDVSSSFAAGVAYAQDPVSGAFGWIDESQEQTNVTTDLLIEINPCPIEPSITSQSMDTPALSFSARTLSVTAVGATGYQWRRNGVPISGATAATYVVPTTLPGQYDCVVSGTCNIQLISQPVNVRFCANTLQHFSGNIGPVARFGVATHPDTGRFLIFGGETSQSHRTVTAVTKVQVPATEANPYDWQEIFPVGASPSARSEHAMSDGPRGPLMFGGRDAAGNVLGDAWEFRNGAWVQLTPIAGQAFPSPRAGGVLAYDSLRNRAVLFGGRDQAGMALRDSWVYNASVGWVEITPAGNAGPLGRWNHAIGFDGERNIFVLFGGRNNVSVLGDTWVLNGENWFVGSSSGPTAREEMTLHFDRREGELRMIGGLDAAGVPVASEWRLDATGWSRVTSSFVYGPMFGHRSTDAANGQMFLAGGYAATQNTQPMSVSYAGPTTATFGSLGPQFNGFDIGGSPVVLRARTSGPFTSIVWRRNGGTISNGPTSSGSVISGVNSPTLQITNPQSTDAGVYTLSLTGPCLSPTVSRAFEVVERCGPADVGSSGGAEGPDQRLDNNDFIVYLNLFFNADPQADLGSQGGSTNPDGLLDSNDLVVFIQFFFAGCV